MPQPNAATLASPAARQFRGFVLAGAVGFLLDAGLTATLAKGLSLSPYVARPPAIALAIFATWLLNRRIAFRSEDPRWVPEMMRYYAVSGMGAAINYAVYFIAVLAFAAMGLTARAPLAMLIAAVAVGSIAAMAFNFIGARRYAFNRQPRG